MKGSDKASAPGFATKVWPRPVLEADSVRKRWLVESQLVPSELTRSWTMPRQTNLANPPDAAPVQSATTPIVSDAQSSGARETASLPTVNASIQREPRHAVALEGVGAEGGPFVHSQPLVLADIEARVRGCKACGLRAGCRQSVPGVGDQLQGGCLIIGEAPGEQEDLRGEPFVGRSGQLLDRMLASIGLSRQHRVYITNVVKCRPPGNRDPLPVELAACRAHLDAQIQALRPAVILLLGRHAAHSLLPGTSEIALGKLRVQERSLDLPWGYVPVVVTYHPAYLLRNPVAKAQAWLDLLRLQTRLEAVLAQSKL